MASFLLLPSPCSLLLKSGNSRTEICNSGRFFTKYLNSGRFSVVSPRVSASTDADSGNGAIESPKRRGGRKKKVTPASADPDPDSPSKEKKSRKKKVQNENTSIAKIPKSVDEHGLWDYDDGMDLPYLDPPLVCCFGAAKNEFVPTVRIHDEQMHPDKYSEWKMLQWDPLEFGRTPENEKPIHLWRQESFLFSCSSPSSSLYLDSLLLRRRMLLLISDLSLSGTLHSSATHISRTASSASPK